MNKTRLPNIIITVSLSFTAILVLLTYQSTIVAKGSTSSYTGMGDFQIYEAQQFSASSEVIENSHTYIGMGDLHLLEALGGSYPYVGMGDLQLFEASRSNLSRAVTEISQPYAGMGDLRIHEARAYSHPYVGMGDLRLLEAQQTYVNSGVRSSRLPEYSCPTSSTSYGERDAGASAPIIVLRETGCIDQGGK